MSTEHLAAGGSTAEPPVGVERPLAGDRECPALPHDLIPPDAIRGALRPRPGTIRPQQEA